MQFENVFIPYGAYWSTPFCRWQGSFAHLHPIKFAGDVAQRALNEREISSETFDALYLGMTVPFKSAFYGGPWLAGLIGATGITGPVVGQACATSAKVLSMASYDVNDGTHNAILAITCDRTSNGPHIYYPNPLGPGGTGEKEDWVWDNFGYDPYAKNAMIQTAENVAKESNISREEQDEVTLMRYEQYQDALKNGSEFLRRFMVMPLEVKDLRGKKTIATVNGDEGVYPTTLEGLAKLKPVLEGGTVTFGSQTYPADGNSAIIVTNRDKAKELSRDKNIEIQVLSYAQARAKKGFMAQAIVPAGKEALSRAGISIKDIKAFKSHTPFAVNDIYFSREMNFDLKNMNNFGCSLITGHPQGPTGSRAIIELIEELVIRGGGYGLFDGCAAGDTGAAVVLKVNIA